MILICASRSDSTTSAGRAAKPAIPWYGHPVYRSAPRPVAEGTRLFSTAGAMLWRSSRRSTSAQAGLVIDRPLRGMDYGVASCYLGRTHHPTWTAGVRLSPGSGRGKKGRHTTRWQRYSCSSLRPTATSSRAQWPVTWRRWDGTNPTSRRASYVWMMKTSTSRRYTTPGQAFGLTSTNRSTKASSCT